MADENWQKVREVFDSSLRRKPEERRKFVNKVCGDDKTLLAEVESLLSSLDSAESFMETPAVAKIAGMIEAETKKLEKGKCLGHYEIIEQIGTGGMGEVYLALDKKLDRQVAVKILKEKFNGHESNLERFTSEAKSASGLNHPNILVVHEVGESENTHFIISEFIKGKTLREILKESSPSLPEVLDIAVQTANALVAAHEAHLVHRDIKPENIMIRPDGLVKVLDFGLAKLVERKNKSVFGLEDSTAQQNQTAKGIILGTINYMSPEQAKGEKVDERTDIFSLGTLIYEMIAGRTPFAGDSVLETLVNLINSEPPPLTHFVGAVPDKLQKIVFKTLRKNADERYQTMKNLLADFEDLRENLTFEEKSEHSSNAPNVLTNRHHFNAERLNSAPTFADWKTDELSETGDNQTQIFEPANAYQAYQLSRYYFHKVSLPDLAKSRAWLEEAVRLDADFAPAYAALAEQLVEEAIIGLQTPAENFPKAKDALRRAADLNPHSAEFYVAAGYVDLICDWNFMQAERNFRKALKLNSHHAFANKYLGQVLMFRCRADEAETYLRQAVEIEPMGLHSGIILTISYFLARNYQKVIEECEKILSVYPRFVIAVSYRCWALEQTGRAAEAVIEYEKILLEPDGEFARRWIGYAYALTGDRKNALKTAARLVAETQEHYISPIGLALLYAGLNETDKACFYLEKAIEKRDPWILFIAADPRYDNLRSDTRFDELVRRVGL
jgi:serine/threonine protein kinase